MPEIVGMNSSRVEITMVDIGASNWNENDTNNNQPYPTARRKACLRRA